MTEEEDSWRQRLMEEGDSYFERNDNNDSAHDLVFEALSYVHATRPISQLLEIGCMDGRRLFRAFREFGCSATGVEASPTAAESAKKRFPEIDVDHGVAPSGLEGLAVDRSFDVIVAGFFLYLLPRPMLFRTVSAIDSLLQVNGFLIISDFLSSYPTRRTYSHDEDFTVYKLDYSQAWTWNPQYTQVHRLVGSHSGSTRNIPSNQQEWVGVDVLMKRDPETTYSFVP